MLCYCPNRYTAIITCGEKLILVSPLLLQLRKKGGLNFGTLRRRKSETDLETLICPMELDVSNIYSPPPALDPDVMFDLSENTSLSPSFTNDNASESTNDVSMKNVPCLGKGGEGHKKGFLHPFCYQEGC